MDLLPQKIKEADPYNILKVKLGTGLDNDKSIIEQIRRETDKTIRVDANEGWDLETGISMSFWLADNNIEFIEQPFKSTNLSDTAQLKIKSPKGEHTWEIAVLHDLWWNSIGNAMA